MSYNDKKNDKIELDDMKIKSHLNASLDLEGISVSEDLINRTLEAIKLQSAEQIVNNEIKDRKEDNTKSENSKKKIIPWNRYIRTIAGAAAAVIIVVTGYNLASNGNGFIASKKSDKDSNTSQVAEQAYDMAATEGTSENSVNSTMMDSFENKEGMAKSEESATSIASNDAKTNDTGASDTEITTVEEAPMFSIAANSLTASEGEGTTGSTGRPDLRSANPSTTANGSAEEVMLSFRDIFLSDPAQAQYITITDEVNGTSITLINQEDIYNFYTVMDNHLFSYQATSTDTTNYTVEIKTPDPNEIFYNMSVGDTVIVNYSDREISSQSIYMAADTAMLIENLREFYQKYSKN